MGTGLQWLSALTILVVLMSQAPAAPGGGAGDPAADQSRAAATDVAELTDDDLPQFVAYLNRAGLPPADYVVAKFQDHDIVILGEIHDVPENLVFIADLIEPLYRRAGVRCLATEFLRHHNAERANKILAAPEYDEAAVVDLYRDFAWVWGKKEYMDILKAVWTLNHSLPPGAKRFRVLGLDHELEEYDVVRAPEEKRAAIREKLGQRDSYMASVFIREAMRGGGKVLVHTGYNHSFTHYRQPIVVDGKLAGEKKPRLGCLLAAKYGKRVVQICLHQPHFGLIPPGGGEPPWLPPLGGLIEKAAAARGNAAFGCDIEGSPFANLRDRASYYFAYQPQVVFSDIAEGYVFLKPDADLHNRCTWVRGFVNESNFEKARGIALWRGWIREEQGTTPAELDEALRVLFETP